MATMGVEVRLLGLPLRAALVAAHDPAPEQVRLLTVVRLETDDGDVGWGECSALNQVGYSSESAQTAYDLLTSDPRLSTHGRGDDVRAEAPMAMAALEMAEFDLRLRSLGVSLASYLGVHRTTVPAGAVISLGSVETTTAQVHQAAQDGFARVKLKVAPEARSGIDPVAVVSAVVNRFEHMEVHVDANGSFDADSIRELEGMVAAGATAVEQPLATQNTALSAELVARGLPVIADESATSLDAVQELIERQACAGVVVKPSRLGGLFPAFELMGWCLENGVAVAAGGMQESGLGRSALAVVAAHEACTITGDVSPAHRWLAADPWDDVEMIEGRITVPTTSGVAPLPEATLLDRYTIASHNRTVGERS
jgi:O-succinylbenzoate synthase